MLLWDHCYEACHEKNRHDRRGSAQHIWERRSETLIRCSFPFYAHHGFPLFLFIQLPFSLVQVPELIHRILPIFCSSISHQSITARHSQVHLLFLEQQVSVSRSCSMTTHRGISSVSYFMGRAASISKQKRVTLAVSMPQHLTAPPKKKQEICARGDTNLYTVVHCIQHCFWSSWNLSPFGY